MGDNESSMGQKISYIVQLIFFQDMREPDSVKMHGAFPFSREMFVSVATPQ